MTPLYDVVTWQSRDTTVTDKVTLRSSLYQQQVYHLFCDMKHIESVKQESQRILSQVYQEALSRRERTQRSIHSPARTCRTRGARHVA